MKKIIGNSWVFILSIVLSAVAVMPAIKAAGMSPQEILAKVDANHKYNTSYSESRMEITIGSRKVTKNLRSWSEGGVDKAFAEFLDKRDQSRMLKLKDDLWLFSPSAESEVKLSGDMLNQGMGGSDYSYRDMLENLHLLELYNVKLLGEESADGRACFVLELTAKSGVEVSYYRRKMWVDQERFIQLREELYAPSGKLLKVSTTEKVEQFGSRWYATVAVMEDKIRKNSNTRMLIDKIQFDVAIPAGTFTRQHLTSR
jgi:outer membrane lipoprotein-sorting protein